jgi:23S rRNA pseudouridine2605 synthase
MERDSQERERKYATHSASRTRRNVDSDKKRTKQAKNPDELVRLNKFIANSGICSRREADEYIVAGLISVNGQTVTELGTKVRKDDDIRFNKERLKGEHKAYLLLNKPKNYITTTDDPHAKKTVMELIEGACKERVYPVGRLDRNTTGVLLFTNDGDLAKQLTHPSYNKLKVYNVKLDKNITKTDLKALVDGVELDDGPAVADSVHVSETDKAELGIEIHSGRNRVIRRMFEKLGYSVVTLDRVYFAGLTKKGLQRGECRRLTPHEVEMLKMGAYE